MNFLFFQSLAVLDIQDTPGLPLLSAMRSHLCLTVPHTCCPSSHNLTPSLEPFVLFLSYPVVFCTGNTSILSGASFYTAVDGPFYHEKVLDSYSKNGMSFIVF